MPRQNVKHYECRFSRNFLRNRPSTLSINTGRSQESSLSHIIHGIEELDSMNVHVSAAIRWRIYRIYSYSIEEIIVSIARRDSSSTMTGEPRLENCHGEKPVVRSGFLCVWWQRRTKKTAQHLKEANKNRKLISAALRNAKSAPKRSKSKWTYTKINGCPLRERLK